MTPRRLNDFEDEGGTPGWRARQQALVARGRRRLTFGDSVVLVIFAGFVLPWTILLGGIALLGA
jgi:hypothetical protein